MISLAPRARWTRVLLLAGLTGALSACSDDDTAASPNDHDAGTGGSAGSSGSGGSAGSDGGVTEPADFVAGGSIRQVWITDASEGDELLLVDAAGHEVARGNADRLGSLILREIAPGDGYTVRRAVGDRLLATPAFRVLSEADVPDASLYQQTLQPGLNYVKMRDGIELAMTVRLPLNKTLADGPFPTVLEISGYQIAAPGDLTKAALGALLTGSGLGSLDDPLLPSTATAVGSLIAPIVGYAAVSVQIRGSGCSGGDFQLFDLPSTYDGYDAVETVAAQPWVKGGKVGLVGISFSGISQFHVAGTRPPHLAAISPMSVTDDLYTGTGFPGGIQNDGFALDWLHEREDNAHPAPEDGAQAYATALVQAGDQHCIDNQKLRVQTQDIDALISTRPFRDAALLDHRAPASWVDDIEVPVFLVGAFHDEQTGPHFPEMLSAFAANPRVWLTMQNGVHVDALGPATVTRWAEFLDLYVGDRIPSLPQFVVDLGPDLYGAIAAGTPSMPYPPLRFDAFTDVALARAKFEEDPRVRLLFDNGGGDLGPGALQPVWERTFDAWPPREAVATSYFLDASGALSPTAPAATSELSYTGDPSLRSERTLGGGGETNDWAPQPSYHWDPVADGASLGFVTAPLASDVLVVGPSSVDLRLKSSARDTDLQVTLSDVRPDGQEMYVQSGWLRASHRKVDPARSTATDPVQTHLASDAADLPAGTFETVRVEVFPVAYAFRAGHRIRLTLQAPGGERTSWEFATIEDGTIVNTVQLGPSALVLPVIAGGTAGAPAPACPSNRGQPCRQYVPASNGG